MRLLEEEKLKSGRALVTEGVDEESKRRLEEQEKEQERLRNLEKEQKEKDHELIETEERLRLLKEELEAARKA